MLDIRQHERLKRRQTATGERLAQWAISTSKNKAALSLAAESYFAHEHCSLCCRVQVIKVWPYALPAAHKDLLDLSWSLNRRAQDPRTNTTRDSEW